MKDIFDKSVEEFDDKFERDFIGIENGYNMEGQQIPRKLKTFLKTHTLALIDAEISKLEGMTRPFKTGQERVDNNEDIVDVTYDAAYNQALHDHLTYLKEQREIISKKK